MPPSQGAPHLERSITLTGAVALVVGGVIGAGIYALVGAIGARAGNATWLAFALAMLISVLGAIPVIQVAGAMPRAGAGYFFCSRLLFPLAGTVTSGIILIGGACSVALTMIALTTYLPPAITFGVPPHLVSLGFLALFYIVMLFGLQMAIGLQVIMVAQMLIALGIYCVGGVLSTSLHVSFVPRGDAGAFLVAVVLCYNACMGFQVLAEMGEEIQHAKRNIPLALLIGGAIVSVIYITIGTVLVNSLPFSAEAYDPRNAPMSASALRFLPGWVVTFVNFGAVTAGLTSLNAGAVALPRELFAQSRDGILPAALSRIGGKTHSPLSAITVFFVLVAALVLPNFDQDFYGLMAAVGIQLVTAALCVASLRLRTRYPALYRSAYIVFPGWALWVCTICTLLFTLAFLVIMANERPAVVIAYAVLAVAFALYHVVRVNWLRRTGVPYDARVRAIPGADESE